MKTVAINPEYVQSPLVAVVIPCFNHGKYLSEAIRSAVRQTYRSVEVVVVDDGSSDNTADVAQSFSEVRYVWRARGGPSAARNTGFRASRGSYLVFLDADDRLLPNAVELGLATFAEHPDCGFVFGAHRSFWTDGRSDEEGFPPLPDDAYEALLRKNFIAMHATVMYPRYVLEEVGGFDETLPACEDYELYLRIARRYTARGHQRVIAEYRKHAENTSRNASLMLTTSVRVLRSQHPLVSGDRRYEGALRDGLRFWQRWYGPTLLLQASSAIGMPSRWPEAARCVLTVFRLAPYALPAAVAKAPRYLARRLVQALPPSLQNRLYLLLGRSPLVGRVNFGELRRVKPIYAQFAYGRGLRVDRYYIEGFLAEHADDIRGRVLEVGDASYTVRFGGGRVMTSDVLHVQPPDPIATIPADLTAADHIPSDTFDCIIMTQTLHLIYDVRAAARTLHRILRPGGVLLATVPGITPSDAGSWHNTGYWSFTARSAAPLLAETFPGADIRVEARGNVLAAISFLHGLPADELTWHELDHRDRGYPVIIAIRAQKPATA